MFQNYIKIALRSFLKYKLDSFLNVSGLVIGMSAALLISLFVRDEYSYDRQWSDAERLYRLQTTWIIQGRDDLVLANSVGPIKPVLTDYFEGDIETTARINRYTGLVKLGDDQYRERITMVDPEVLDIFDFKMISGDARAALGDTSTIILNEQMSEKYFGDQDPIGKTLYLDDFEQDFTVGAVMEDLPDNTHLMINFLIAIDETRERFQDRFTDWQQANNHTYFKLTQDGNINSVNSRMLDFTDNYFPANDDDSIKASDFNKLNNIAVVDIHLDGFGLGTMKPGGDRDLVFALAVISALIIVVAAINFVNLSTARASRRAREVALRKVLGASRQQLIYQYMGEAFSLTIISAIIAYLVASLALPSLNEILTKELQLILSDPFTRNLIISVTVIIGTLSGLYPALVLSSFRPVKYLHANKSSETRGTTEARNLLVIFQSVVTIALIIATSVIFAQLTYFRIADRGFDPENLLIISGLGEDTTKPSNKTFKEEVLKIQGVESAALLQEAPTDYNEQNTLLYMSDGDQMNSVMLGKTSVGPDFFKTMKIPLIAGRYYDAERPFDFTPDDITEAGGEARSLVINEGAVKTLGIASPEEAIGRTFRRNVSLNEEPILINLVVIGVVADAQIHTIKRSARPEMYFATSNFYSLAIRVPGDPQVVLGEVEELWQNMYPGELFRHYYVEDALAREYQVEQGQMSLFLTFAVLTIVIGCLGLYGLAVFVAERRTKEIGIRKVLGATIADILRLLIWQFSKPVLVANIFAWPIAGYYMIEWLSQYPSRLESPWVGLFCVAAGLIALMIAWVTVGTQAFKVARKNPIHALRYE